MKRKAFTLVEILIVVILLGILATIAISSFGDAGADTTESARVTTERTLLSAVSVYVARNQALPTVAQLQAAGATIDTSKWTVTIGGTTALPTVSVAVAVAP